MKRSDQNPQDAWMDARLEAYLDGDLPAGDANRFEQLLADDEGWQATLHLAARVRDGLHALPRPACPPELTRSVLAEVRRQAAPAPPGRLQAWLDRWWASWLQPSLAMALLVALVVLAALPGPRTAGFAHDDVETALAEAKWTLAYLSQVGRHTGRSVRHDVLENRVVAPVQEALGSILDETKSDH